MSTVATKLPAEIKKLSDLDAIFVDLRVSSMDEAILAVLEGKKLDSDGFGQAVKDALCARGCLPKSRQGSAVLPSRGGMGCRHACSGWPSSRSTAARPRAASEAAGTAPAAWLRRRWGHPKT